MRSNPGVQVSDVQAVYNGAQAQLYELFMGQQIHIGGLQSTLELAERAGVQAGQRGVELCCGTGASMRALVRLLDVSSMVGVELAAAPAERGRETCRAQGPRSEGPITMAMAALAGCIAVIRLVTLARRAPRPVRVRMPHLVERATTVTSVMATGPPVPVPLRT